MEGGSVRVEASQTGSAARARAARLVDRGLPAALALVAEGAWIAVLYALVEAASRQPIYLGVVAFALAAIAGAAAATFGLRGARGAWPLLAVGLVGAGAVGGWLVVGPARDVLLAGDAAASLGRHPGGWLIGVALLRGVAAVRPRDEARPSGTLLALGMPALVVAFLVGAWLPEPSRSVFSTAAFPELVVFLVASLVGLALARFRHVAGVAALEWYRNATWLALLLALVLAIVVAALPTAFTIGPIVTLVIATLPVPLFFAGLFVGIDRRLLTALLSTLGITIAVVILIHLLFPAAGNTSPLNGPRAAGTPTTDTQMWVVVAGSVFAIVALAVAVAIFAAFWMRRTVRADDWDVAEERVIDRGAGPQSGWRWRLPRIGRERAAEPRDAVEAYLSAIAVLASQDDLRRQRGETPAEHAARVRSAVESPAPRVPGGALAAPRTGLAPIPGAVARLAADYELARFGGRRLPAREHRRALARWASIREAIANRHGGGPGTQAGQRPRAESRGAGPDPEP